MTRKPLITLLTIALAVAVTLGLGASPAQAHNFDDNSLWVCAYTRPGAAYSIDHSWPNYLSNGVVHEVCMAHNVYSGGQVCWGAWWYVNSGVIQRNGPYYWGDCPWGPPHS